MEKSNNNNKSSFAVDFMMGGVSAAVGKTAAAPIERIKLLMQSEEEMIKTGKLDRPYNGMIDCFRRTVAKEGVISLWQGNSANVIRYFPTQALNFAFKDYAKRSFDVPKSASQMEKLLANIAAGSMAGAASSVFVYHLDYARTRLANDLKSAETGKGQFNGLIDVYRKTMRTDGFVGLYRGFNISLVGIVVYRGLYFGVYDSCKPALAPLQDNPALLGLASFLLGWGVTIGASMVSYPIDTVRRRMMMTSGEAVKYKSSLHAFAQITRKEGVKALFKGADANILRAIAGASVLAGYDLLQFTMFGKAFSGGG